MHSAYPGCDIALLRRLAKDVIRQIYSTLHWILKSLGRTIRHCLQAGVDKIDGTVRRSVYEQGGVGGGIVGVCNDLLHVVQLRRFKIDDGDSLVYVVQIPYPNP